MVDAEKFARATEAGLHLVGDEQDIVVVANRAEARQEVRRWHNGPRLALHRFNDDRGHAVTHHMGCFEFLLHRTSAAIGHKAHAFEQRQEGLAEDRFAGHGQRPECLPVEPFLHRNDALLPGVELGQFQRAFDRFGPAVGKEAFLDVPGGDVRNDAAELRAEGIEHFLGVLRRAVELRFDRFDDFRMTQSVAVEPEAAEHVDELAPKGITDQRALALPLGEGEFTAEGGRLAVFEKPRIDVLGEIFHRLLGNPLPRLKRDVLGRLLDQIEHPPRFLQGVFVIAQMRGFQMLG